MNKLLIPGLITLGLVLSASGSFAQENQSTNQRIEQQRMQSKKQNSTMQDVARFPGEVTSVSTEDNIKYTVQIKDKEGNEHTFTVPSSKEVKELRKGDKVEISLVFSALTLPTYNIDMSQSSVSGVSSGASMAVQFHVAFSSTIVGAGVIAGNPYYCARGNRSFIFQWYYIHQCMNPSFWMPNPNAQALVKHAQEFADTNKIDNLNNVRYDKIYIFSGKNDIVVSQPVVDRVKEFYRLAGVRENNIKYVNTLNSGHSFVTENYGNTCDETGPPFIADCDYDQAGAILKHIYGNLTPPAPPANNGKIIEFSQNEFINDPRSHSMSDVGYAYVPNSCAEGNNCKVHVAFHGCSQTIEDTGDLFYTKTGYNRWAATNDIIILYPQLVHLPSEINPLGCWDWWGYDSDNYYNKNGYQMAAVMRMIKRLAGQDQLLY